MCAGNISQDERGICSLNFCRHGPRRQLWNDEAVSVHRINLLNISQMSFSYPKDEADAIVINVFNENA